jgi:hypothetical protein
MLTSNQRYRLLRRTTNLALHSSAQDNAAWTKSNITATAAGAAAPFGSLFPGASTQAVTLTESTALNVHRVGQNMSGLLSGVDYVLSAYVKYINRNARVQFLNKNNTSYGMDVDLQTGEYGDFTNGLATGGAERVSSDGWFRIWATGPSGSGGTTPQIRVALLDGFGGSYQGIAATPGIYVWGVQFEEGQTPSQYIPTTTAAVSAP